MQPRGVAMRMAVIAALILMPFLHLQSVLAADELAVTAEEMEKAKAEQQVANVSGMMPIDADELKNVRAGEAPLVEVATEQNLNATVTGNRITAGTVSTGTVNIGDNALGFHGIGNFVINTGNNNVLQGSLSVTVLSGSGN
jgi:hypothetical protein